jgi:hypothetical protein
MTDNLCGKLIDTTCTVIEIVIRNASPFTQLRILIAGNPVYYISLLWRTYTVIISYYSFWLYNITLLALFLALSVGLSLLAVLQLLEIKDNG